MTSITDYRTLGRIGEGQFGTIDAVVALKTGQVLAMKTITKATVARHHMDLYSERDIHLRASRHVPSLFACFRSATSFHLVMEYTPYGSLWDHITVAGSPSTRILHEGEIGWWGNQMIDSIAWLHSQGYVHRDIKPQNFLLFPDKLLKLTDFGSVARLVDGIVDPDQCFIPVGTPDYIAPEILELSEALMNGSSAQPYSAAVDWWSLGATLYELLVGRPPFFADSIHQTYQKIKTFDFVQPPSLQSLFAITICAKNERQKPSNMYSTSPSSITPVQPTAYNESASDTAPFFDLSDDVTRYGLPPSDHDRWADWTYQTPVSGKVVPTTPPPAARGGVPHSTLRHRHMSDKRAYEVLLHCVKNNAQNSVLTVDELEEWLARDRLRLQVSLYNNKWLISELGGPRRQASARRSFKID